MPEEVADFVPSAPADLVTTPAEPVEPPVEPPADPDESDAIELPTGKHVPLSALKAQREENKALKQQLASTDFVVGLITGPVGWVVVGGATIGALAKRTASYICARARLQKVPA